MLLRLSRNIDKMNSTADIFHAYLKKRRLRTTPERFVILDEIIRLRRHFDADGLLLSIKTRNKKISRATIYRTLELLIDCGLVKKTNINTPAVHSFYESMDGLGRHDHFICQVCGKIIEFYDEQLKKIEQNLQETYGMKVEYYSYYLYGRCASCLNKHKRGK